MAEQAFYKLYNHIGILSKYLNLPQKAIKKVCKWDHGWTPLDKPLVKELSSPKNIVLVWSKRRKKIIEDHTSKKAFITGVPFMEYRKRHGITKKNQAKGNVFFAAHSSQQTDIRYNVDDLQRHIDQLPEDYKPTTICLYWLDIDKGYQVLYERLGYEVVTAGDPYSPDFVGKFYEILSSHAYCSSNSFGTYSLYALDLDIPFFLIGEKPELVNNGDKNLSLDRGQAFFDIKERVETLFRYQGNEIGIGDPQRTFFLEETGENDKDSTFSIRAWILFYWIKSRIIPLKRR